MKPMARRTDPSTSHEAAAIVRATGLQLTQQEVTAALLEDYPGKTYRELYALHEAGCDAAGVPGVFENAVGLMRRLNEVAHKGDKRICTVSGRRSVTWYGGEA